MDGPKKQKFSIYRASELEILNLKLMDSLKTKITLMKGPNFWNFVNLAYGGPIKLEMEFWMYRTLCEDLNDWMLKKFLGFWNFMWDT
mgnify:CR=1 FL=1